MGALDTFLAQPTPKPSSPALDAFTAPTPKATPALDAFLQPPATTMASPTLNTKVAASTPTAVPSKAPADNSALGIFKNTVTGLPKAAADVGKYVYSQGVQTLLPGVTPEEAASPTFLAKELAPEVIPSAVKLGEDIVKHPIVSAAQVGQGTALGALDSVARMMMNIPGLVPNGEQKGTLEALHNTFVEHLFPEGQNDIGKGFETAGGTALPILASGAAAEGAAAVGAKALGQFAAGTGGMVTANQLQLPSDSTLQERAQNALDSLVQQGLLTAGTAGYHVAKGMLVEGAKNAYHAAAANMPNLQEAQRGFVKVPGLGSEDEGTTPEKTDPALTELAQGQKSPSDFRMALSPDELKRVQVATGIDDPTAAAEKFYSDAKLVAEEKVDPLTAEARKYKTPEEFVKAQGDPLYHGTQAQNIRGTPNPTDGKMGRAFYLNADKTKAEAFGKEKNVQEEVTTTSGKKVTRTLREPNAHPTSNVYSFDTSKLKIKKVTDKQFFDETGDDAPDKYYRLAGYDGVYNTDTGTYAIYNTDKLQRVDTQAAARAAGGRSLSATGFEANKSEPVKDAVNESLTKARLDASKIETESLPEILSSLKIPPSKVKNVVLEDLPAIRELYTNIDKKASEFDALLSQLGVQDKTVDIKSLSSVLDKLSRKRDPSRGRSRTYTAGDIQDFIRGSGTVDSPAAARALVAKLGDQKVTVHDLFDTPNEWGYRGMNINVKLSDGTIGEIQIHTPETKAVQDAIHPIYDQYRHTPIEEIPASVLDASNQAAKKATLQVESKAPTTPKKPKFSPNLLKSISQEKNPFEISKILETELPKLTPKTRDYIATSLAGMSRTGDIEGMLTAAKNATRDLKNGGVSAERRARQQETTQTESASATSRTAADTNSPTPIEQSRASDTQTATSGLPRSIGELLTTQESSTYIDSITKSIKDKESAVLAQQEYDAMWEQADQRVIDRANELAIMKEMLQEQVDLHPGRKLTKYATNGQLPEVTGKDKRIHPVTGKKVPNTTWGMRGDDIATEIGLESSDKAQGALDDFNRMRSQLEDITQELRELKPRARAAKILQGMIDEVPVVAQEKAGAVTVLTDGDSVRKYRDISGFMGQARDLYRNFEAFFGDRYDEVKKAVLDPFDKSKGDMVDEIHKQADELEENVTKKYKINRGSKKAQAIMDWGEREIVSRGENVPGMNFDYTTQSGLIKAFGIDGAKDVMDAEQWFRNKYNQLIDEANDVRAKIYPNDPTKLIPKRKDYFRHYKEQGGDFAALRDLIENAAGIHPGIDPTLAGLSEFTSPKSKFLSFAKERIGQGSDRDAIAGFIDYAPAFAYMKHIDPHIGVFRYLRRSLAHNAPTPGVTEVTEGGTVKTKQKGINNFLEYLNDFSNDLAGKTNPMDRYLQKVIPGGRITMRVIDWTNSRVKSNQILGNLSSAVAQAFNVPQGIGSAKLYTLPGTKRVLSSIFVPDHAMAQSSFLKERFIEPLQERFQIDWAQHPVKRGFSEAKDFAAWTMQAFDEAGTKLIWTSHYEKGLAQGHADPIKYADDVTRKMVAGRGVGEVALIQKSKIFKLVAPFQVEVSNSWFVMKDMVRAKDFGGIALFFAAAYVMNAAAQQIRGSGVVFDPINSLIDGATQAADEMHNTGNAKTAAFKFAGRQAGEILSNLPLGQTIAQAVPDSLVQGATGLGGTPMDKAHFFGSADPGRFGGGLLLINGLEDPLYKLIPSFGGAQIKRSVQGVQALLSGKTLDSKGKPAFTVSPTIQNVIQAVLFGKNATAEAQQYYNQRDDLFQRTYSQTAQRTQTTLDAEAKWKELKKMADTQGKDAAAKAFDDLATSDPALAQKVGDIATQEQKGINGNDRMVLMLGVQNGERAKYLADQFDSLKTKEEKAALWEHMSEIKAITPAVSQQLEVLLAQ